MKKSLFIGFLIALFVFILGGMPHEVSAKQDQLIIINKSDNTLHFYDNGKKVKSFRVATGKRSNLTPEGTFSVKLKWSCPVYYATNKKGCTSSNPLGPRWIGLSVPGTTGYTYGIHGTNQESSIGSYASSGCVRMYNKEVTWLFDQVKLGAKVVIIRSNKSADTIATEKGYSLTNTTKKQSSTTPKDTPKDTVTNQTTYKVQKGETLWKISQKFKVSVNDLKKWNHLSNNDIKTGQTLIVSSTNTNKNTSTQPKVMP